MGTNDQQPILAALTFKHTQRVCCLLETTCCRAQTIVLFLLLLLQTNSLSSYWSEAK